MPVYRANSLFRRINFLIGQKKSLFGSAGEFGRKRLTRLVNLPPKWPRKAEIRHHSLLNSLLSGNSRPSLPTTAPRQPLRGAAIQCLF